MNEPDAVAAFGALAHPVRLNVFRLLIRRGPSGLPAGAIAESVGQSPSALSFHLGHMERAGLLRARRAHRHIFYAVDIEGTRQLLTYLTEDCCGGRPEICGGLGNALQECDPA